MGAYFLVLHDVDININLEFKSSNTTTVEVNIIFLIHKAIH